MWVGGDTCNLPVHPVGLLQGSDPLRKLWSFSSCPFVSGELGDGESSARQPNCIGIAKEITHVCEHLFRGLQPMRGRVQRRGLGWHMVGVIVGSLETSRRKE